MSETSRAVSDAHIQYLSERTTQEDQLLVDLKAAADAAGIPRIWISPEQAAFMEILLRAARARDVVEVGTLAGYAAIRMARALDVGGRVRTIELDPTRAAFAREWAAKAGMSDVIEVLDGDARDVLRSMDAASADVAFIDADKDGYADYLEECLRIVRLGGLILVDNAFGFGQLLGGDGGDTDVTAIREFNDSIAKRSELRSIIVPFGDGCWVGVKVAEPA